MSRLREPEIFLRHNAERLVCLDELQRVPDLFPIIRALVDEDRRPRRPLILGSASPEMLRRSTETLAGRIAYIDSTLFAVEEVGGEQLHAFWLRGGFLESFLAADEAASHLRRQQLVRTFLEADLPAMGIDLTTQTIRCLWQMLAIVSGSLMNKAKPAGLVGVSPQSIARHIDVLEATFMVRVLRPRVLKTDTRLVKSPKVYVRYAGLLHTILAIETRSDLLGHVEIGASWASYAVEQICSGLPGRDASFYRTSDRA